MEINTRRLTCSNDTYVQVENVFDGHVGCDVQCEGMSRVCRVLEDSPSINGSCVSADVTYKETSRYLRADSLFITSPRTSATKSTFGEGGSRGCVERCGHAPPHPHTRARGLHVAPSDEDSANHRSSFLPLRCSTAILQKPCSPKPLLAGGLEMSVLASLDGAVHHLPPPSSLSPQSRTLWLPCTTAPG